MWLGMSRDMIDEDIRRARTLPVSFYREPACSSA